MKEKMITFTRNKKNIGWIFVAMILLGAIGIGVDKLPCSFGFFVLKLGIRFVLLIALWFVYGIYHLFKLKKEEIRDNDCLSLLATDPKFLWLPIASVETVIYSTLSIVFNKPTTILVLIFLVPLSMFLAILATKYFEK